MKYLITLFDDDTTIITAEQYEQLIKDSTEGKMGIIVDEHYINFKAIQSIKPHSVADPAPTYKELKLLDVAKEKSNRPNQIWWECLAKNRNLLADHKLPRFTVEQGVIVERERYWAK